MPTVDFTLEELVNVIDKRLDTKLNASFMDLVEYNLKPAFETLDGRLDNIEDSLARLQIDMRHVKSVLRTHHVDIAALKAPTA